MIYKTAWAGEVAGGKCLEGCADPRGGENIPFPFTLKVTLTSPSVAGVALPLPEQEVRPVMSGFGQLPAPTFASPGS